MGTVRTASVPPWMRSRALGKASLINSLYHAFVVAIMDWHYIGTMM